MVACAYKAHERLRKNDYDFKASLGYIKSNLKKKMRVLYMFLKNERQNI